MEKVRPWCGQPSDRGRLKEQNRTDADWPPTGDAPLKFGIKKKEDGRGRHLDKPHKSRYHNKGLTDLRLREIWHDNAKWVS